jgi:hypothetical protein
MIARTGWAMGMAMGCLSAACATPRDTPHPRDTLVVQPVAPSPAAPSPAAVAAPDGPVLRESLGYKLHVAVGFTAASAAAPLPELAMVAADGRRTGFDPATKRSLWQLPGGDYYDTPVLDDDDAPPRDALPAAKPEIDLRELDVPSHSGERYTLEVAATDPGTFALILHLYPSYPGRAGGSADKQMDAVAFGRGQVRRFAIQIGAGTMEVSELHSP